MPRCQPIQPLSPPPPPANGAPPAIVRFAVLAVALAGLISPRPARADETPAGVVVQFPAVLTADTAVRLRAAVDVPLKRYQRDRLRQGQPTTGFKLLCDFNADGDESTNDFGVCSDLADALRDYQQKYGVATRAYVHGDISRQAVLPVLACGEIVMSADPPARLGPVTDADHFLDDSKYGAYKAMAFGHFPLAIVRKMYDRNLVVVKMSLPLKEGDRYIDKAEVKAPLNSEDVAGLGAGEIASYDYAHALEYGLTKEVKQNSLADARKNFGLPDGAAAYALRDATVASQIKVEGAIDGTLRDDLEGRLNSALHDKANVLILDLECGGGDDRSAYDMARTIAGLKTHTAQPIKTIAYVSSSASDLSAFLALSCDEIVMQEDATLGRDFQAYLKDHPARVEAIRDELRETAEKSVYPAALAEALVNPDVRLVRADDGAILTGDEWNADPKKHGANATEIKPAGAWLQFGAADAHKYGVADRVVKDYAELCSDENVKPVQIEGDWLQALSGFLRSDVVSVLLVMLGVTCLIIELKMPGASVPGVIAAVCFLLFFWSESQVAGQITWLAVLLFLLGLILIGIEVFLVPGTGVCGVSGVLLTVGGLALMAFRKMPQTTTDWMGFGQKLWPFSVGIIVSVFAAVTAVRYLKHIPYLNRLLLKAPGEAGEDGETAAPEPHQPELAALLGAVGVAVTPLRPAGKTQFGEQFVDVVAEGGYVPPGARVQVIEIEGNRVVVKEV